MTTTDQDRFIETLSTSRGGAQLRVVPLRDRGAVLVLCEGHDPLRVPAAAVGARRASLADLNRAGVLEGVA